MKLLSMLLALISLPAQAGTLLWVDSSTLTSYDYNYGNNCDSVVLGVGAQKYTFKFCSLQELVKNDMDSLLTSPSTAQCVRSENCQGDRCYREYGTRQESTKILLILGTKPGEIDSYKVKRDLGACL